MSTRGKRVTVTSCTKKTWRNINNVEARKYQISMSCGHWKYREGSEGPAQVGDKAFCRKCEIQ